MSPLGRSAGGVGNARGAAALVLIVVSWVAAVPLHRHEFAKLVAYDRNGVPRLDRLSTLPVQKDPASVLLALGGPAVALALCGYRFRRGAVALGVLASVFASAVYLHQGHLPRFFCPPGSLCPLVPSGPKWWLDAEAVNVAAWGTVAAAAVLLYRALPPRWFGVPWSRLRSAASRLRWGFSPSCSTPSPLPAWPGRSWR
jgi:hypothetical protein